MGSLFKTITIKNYYFRVAGKWPSFIKGGIDMDVVTVDAIEEAKKELLSKIEYNGGYRLPFEECDA